MDAPTTSQLAQQGCRHRVIDMDNEPEPFNGIITLVEPTETSRDDTIDILDIQKEMYDHA